MGVRKVRVPKKKYRPKYPNAGDKITYYDNLITQLTDCKNAAYNAKIFFIRSGATKVENPDAEGPYHDEYLTHKDNWFANNKTLADSFEAYIDLIRDQIKEAQNLKSSSDKDYDGYYRQPVEEDAKAFAAVA